MSIGYKTRFNGFLDGKEYAKGNNFEEINRKMHFLVYKRVYNVDIATECVLRRSPLNENRYY